MLLQASPRAALKALTATAGIAAAIVIARAGMRKLHLLRHTRSDGVSSPSCTKEQPAAVSCAATLEEQPTGRERAAAHLRFGNVCARSGQYTRAFKHYLQAIELRPGAANAHHNAASVCQRLQRFDEAVSHYEHALARKPSLLEAATNLAVAQLNCKRPQDAMRSCYRALELQATLHDAGGNMPRLNAEAFANLNIALRLCGERERAISETWRQIESLRNQAPRRSYPISNRSSPPGRQGEGTVVATRRVLGVEGVAAESLTVVCVKWGSKYGAAYVNRLRAGVGRGLVGVPHRFVCFTDDASGLRDDVLVRPLESRRDWSGWWYKAQLFSEAAGLWGRVLYLDLDTVIVGSLAPLLQYYGMFATLCASGFEAEEAVEGGYNSSIMLWHAGADAEEDRGADANVFVAPELRQLHDALDEAVFSCLMRWDHWLEMVVPSADIVQDLFPSLVVDYRRHCRELGPPSDSAIVCFPRSPKPHEARDAWVLAMWTE